MQTKRAGMNWFVPYLYVLPALLTLGIFVYIPVVTNFYYATLDFSAFSPTKQFVGLANFAKMLNDEVVRIAIVNNLWYCVISLIFQCGLSLCIAAVLEDKLLRRISTTFRTMYFLPVLISVTVVAFLFNYIYHSKVGLLNTGLKIIGMGDLKHAWIASTDTSIFAAIAMSQWHSMGYTMMLYIVAIQGIPGDLYEAAEIDGAGRLRKFIHVTLPQVREMAFVTCVTTVTGAFLVFNDVYVLTGGGPGYSSTTLAVYMYQNGFKLDKMGYASALSVFMLVICLILAYIQNNAFRTGKGD